MRYVNFYCGSRTQPSFCDAESERVFEVLDARIHQRPTKFAELAASVPTDFLRFSLWFHHIFGRKQYFLIDCAGESRLIYGESDGIYEGSVVAKIEWFERQIKDAFNYLESLESKESKENQRGQARINF